MNSNAGAKNVFDIYQTIANPRLVDKTGVRRDVTVVLPQFSVDMIEMSRQRIEKELIPVRELYNFAKRFEGPKRRAVMPEILVLETEKFNKAIGPPKNGNDRNTEVFDKFMALNPMVGRYYGRMLTSLLGDILTVPITRAEGLFSSLLEQLELSTNRSGAVNKLPSRIAGGDGEQFVRQLVHVMAAPQYFVLHVSFDWTKEPSPDEFINLLLLKLCVPSTVLDEMARIDIDNRIFFYLEVYYRMRNVAVKFDIDVAKTSVRNMLVEALDNNDYGFKADAKRFLYTNESLPGSGWSTTSEYETGLMDPEIAGFVGHGGYAWTPICSKYNRNPAGNGVVTGKQFQYFKSFVDELASEKRLMPVNKGIGSAIVTILSHVARQSVAFTAMMASLTEVSHKVTLLGPYRAAVPSSPLIARQRLPIEMVMGALPAIVLTDWPSVAVSGIAEWSVAQFSVALQRWAQDLANWTWFVNEHYASKLWTDNQRKRMVRQMINPKYDLGFNKSLFDDEALTKPAIDFLILPDSSYADVDFINQLMYVKRFVEANPELHGYAPDFYYGVVEAIKEDDVFEYRLKVPETEVIDVSISDLITLASEHRFTQFFEGAKANGLTIRIDHPIYIEKKETRVRFDQQNPIVPFWGETAYQVNPITWPFAFEDEHLRFDLNSAFTVDKPLWGIKNIPFLLRDETQIANWIKQVSVLREGFKIYNDIEFKLRHVSEMK
jgi:hypothetical protein